MADSQLREGLQGGVWEERREGEEVRERGKEVYWYLLRANYW